MQQGRAYEDRKTDLEDRNFEITQKKRELRKRAKNSYMIYGYPYILTNVGIPDRRQRQEVNLKNNS